MAAQAIREPFQVTESGDVHEAHACRELSEVTRLLTPNTWECLLLRHDMSTIADTHGVPEPLDVATRHAIRQVRDCAMFLIDRNGRAASWNVGVGEILRWPENDWVGQPLHVAFTQEDCEARVPERELFAAASTGRADDDRWMKRRDGQLFFANGTVTRILDENGELVGYLKVLRDGTVLKRTADALQRAVEADRKARRDAEHQAAVLRATIDAIPDAVFIGNADGITQCNAHALALLGAGSLHDIQVGMDVLVSRYRLRRERHGELLDPSTLPFARALRGETALLETWATKPTGEELLIRGTAAPIVVDGGTIGAVAISSDLTNQVLLQQQSHQLARVEERLRVRDEEFRALVMGVRDYAIFTVDPDGRISSWHVGAQLMKGYTDAEAIGMPFSQLFTPEQRQQDRPRQEMEFAARTGEYKGEGPRIRKNGEIFEAAVVLTALRGPNDELLGYLKLTQDITRRKQVELEREQLLRDAEAARHDAEHASHAKGEFLATISHELRTPLSAILGWSLLLERGLADPSMVKHGLAAITRNARTQVQLIEDLLDMNRIESGQLKIQMEPVELAETVVAAIEEVQLQARAKGVAIGTKVDPMSGPVMADPTRLQQILWNLLVNAVKFTPAGGRVTVSVTRKAGTVEIAVQDTGQGMSREFIAQAFDRFRQQDATSTRRHGGLGLGLAIVRQLVNLHNGHVRAASPGAGLGSTFTVCLPSWDAPLVSSSAAPIESPLQNVEHRLSGYKILLVDDETDVREVAALALRAAGANVIVAADAKSALATFRQDEPDAVLCDIGMPDHDGYEFIRRLRELETPAGRRTPAAALTAYARAEDRQRALDCGYQAHFVKPLGPDSLVEATARLLRDGPGPRS